MMSRRARVIALWLVCVAAALAVVVRASYITDLSAFLPAKPTAAQRLLVDQLRDGPASRLILIGLEGGSAERRAALSRRIAARLRGDARLAGVENGEPVNAERDRELLFAHRYLLSEAVTTDHFSVPRLRAAIDDSLQSLASSAGLLLKSLLPHDPTGELLAIIERLSAAAAPRTADGVWVSRSGARALLVAQTVAAGSDTDEQERAQQAIRRAFAAADHELGAAPAGAAVTLKMSGPGVFAVAARSKIKNAALRLSLVSSALVIAVLLAVYRSLAALLLGLLPVVCGALAGIAAVALGFGAIHGITLGFGITLIGESVDYSIYFFIQTLRQSRSPADTGGWLHTLWPTIRLGMLTSVCGFASLLPSGFPGLAQLGLYSISGLIAAALVTRFVLPELLPRNFRIHDVTGIGLRLQQGLRALQSRGRAFLGPAAGALALAAMALLYVHRDGLWNSELSALSPVPAADLAYDAALRADLGAPNALDVVVVSAPDLESALRGAERAGKVLDGLVAGGVIGSYDSPTQFLPSLATQATRRSALPDDATLRANLGRATAGSDLSAAHLEPFLTDVAAARTAPLLTPRDLQGTSLASGFNALTLHQASQWNALLLMHPVDSAHADIDGARVAAALAQARLPQDTHIVDLKKETDALYADYLHEAIRLSAAGAVMIVLLLSIALRSVRRVLRVLAPLLLAVLTVAATLALCGQMLNILHLVGMLLIVAVGSNYALFFDRERGAEREGAALTLASLLFANVATVLGFGLLGFSGVPVLEALGVTVAPGAFLALLFAAILARPTGPAGVLRA